MGITTASPLPRKLPCIPSSQAGSLAWSSSWSPTCFKRACLPAVLAEAGLATGWVEPSTPQVPTFLPNRHPQPRLGVKCHGNKCVGHKGSGTRRA